MHKQFRGETVIKNFEKDIRVDYYLVAETKLFNEDNKPRETYGIEIVENDEESELIRDITTDERTAISIIDTIKTNEVLPIHLHDVIEDLL